MSKVNIPLLRKAVEWAEAEAAKPPELCEWAQIEYLVPPERRAAFGLAEAAQGCGTAYCIAGYVGAQSDPRYAVCSSVDGIHVSNYAATELGLGFQASVELFDANNTIEDVRRIAEDIAGERL